MQSSPSPPSPPLTETARELATRTEAVRRRHGGVALATGAAMALVVILGWLAAEGVADWLVALPWLARFAFLVAGIGVAGLLGWRCGLRPWRHRPDDDAVALMVERALPAFRSRFIAAVQLARGDAASTPLVRALVAETTALAATLTFRDVVRTDRLRRWLKIAIASFLGAAALAALGGRNTLPLLTRALLWNNPVPRKTQISGVTGHRVVAIGDDVQLEATAGGMIPAHGHLLVRTASGRRQEFVFAPEAGDRAHFVRVLQSVQEPFAYSIALGDARTDVFRVKVKPRPAVASVECTQIFPAYTRLPPLRRALGDLKILAGSRLALRVKATNPVQTATIQLLAAEPDKVLAEAPLVPDASHLMLAGEIEIPAKDAAGLTLRLVDEDGLESRGGAVYRLELLQDQPPTIKILWPDRREELLTRNATMLLAFEARDDYGLGKVRLHYAVDYVEGAPHRTIDLDLGNESPRTLTRRFNWKIGQITPHVEEGNTIDYWFEVLDTNNVTGPGIGTLDHYQARLVSELEKRADLANRLSDTMEGLNEVRQGQEAVAQKLGEIIFEKPPAP
ncbi:MAG: hypothetical protein QOE70_5156 [Chthoniobacter sp.]|nr:hypothetical protein [Chthoniobacter sp.]